VFRAFDLEREIDTLTGRFERTNSKALARFLQRCTLSARHRSENNHSPVAQIVAMVGWSLQGLFAYANRQSTAFLRFSPLLLPLLVSETRPRRERNVINVNIVINANDLPYPTNFFLRCLRTFSRFFRRSEKHASHCPFALARFFPFLGSYPSYSLVLKRRGAFFTSKRVFRYARDWQRKNRLGIRWRPRRFPQVLSLRTATKAEITI